MTAAPWTRPWALAFLAAAVGAVFLYAAHFRWKARAAARLGDPSLLKGLTNADAARRQRVKAALSVCALALLAVALAGPRYGRAREDVRRRGVDVVIAVDVSASMLAEDVKPSRLVQAKRELGLLIDGLDGDRVGVVAFAGAAFLQCPLTLDYAAAKSILDLVGPDLIPAPGTDIAAALDTALDALPAGTRKHKAVVLLTDGEDHSGRLDQAVRRAAEAGARVFPVGIGSPSGEVIPVRDDAGRVTDYKKDRAGKTVVSKLGEAALADMAARTGGTYHRASPGEGEIERVLDDLRGLEKKTLENRFYDRARDRYRWPLGLAMLLLVLEFFWPERPWAEVRTSARFPGKTPLLLLCGLAAAPARAAGRTPGPDAYRRAAAAWRRNVDGNPEDPAAHFNLGQALYRSRDFPGAAQSFAKAQALFKDDARRAQAAYDAGNALARAGKDADALEEYKDALRRAPDDADAKHNYEVVQKRMKDRKNGKGDGSTGKKEEKSGAGKTPRAAEKDAGKAPSRRGAMTKEDADRVLQAVERQEQEARKKVKAPASAAPSTGEDW